MGMPSPGVWLEWSVWSRVAGLLEWVLAGAAAYFLVLYLGGLRIRTLLPQHHDEDSRPDAL
jgi:hypothetical protein